MDASTTELISTRSKLGDSLSQIAQLSGLTTDQVQKTLGQAAGLTSEEVSIIIHMNKEGHSLEQISQEVQVALEVLNEFLTQVQETADDSTNVSTTKQEPVTPQFFYGSKMNTGKLIRLNLLSGEASSYQLFGHRLKDSCRWSELPTHYWRVLCEGGSEG
jgi:lambda repressor-like predicted transcriptional regulator